MNLENNFWLEYPNLKLSEELNKLYNSDKSKAKEESSKIMWAIYLATNPSSDFYNNPSKYEILEKNFIKSSKFKWKNYENVVNEYKEFGLTSAERALNSWNEVMELRDRTLKNMYKEAAEAKNIGSLTELDKMLSNTAKMFNDYKKVKEDFTNEKLKKGNKTHSLADNKDF